jgi:hypothetical protein
MPAMDAAIPEHKLVRAIVADGSADATEDATRATK